MICDFCTKENECNLICSDIYCREFFHEMPFEEIKPGDTLYQIYIANMMEKHDDILENELLKALEKMR